MPLPAAGPAPPVPPRLLEVLGRARDLGYLGPGDVDQHVRHALGFAGAAASGGEGGIPDEGPGHVLDLGSGGGLPGLVLAARWPHSAVVLLDANGRRTTFLAEAAQSLGWVPRVRVVRDRAEAAGRDPELRGAFDLVVARSFASPAVTAECGAPFLRLGGLLIVSEPPLEGPGDPAPVETQAGQRWPASALLELGLEAAGPRLECGGFGFQVLRSTGPCPARYPRRVGVPAKRPLFAGPAPTGPEG